MKSKLQKISFLIIMLFVLIISVGCGKKNNDFEFEKNKSLGGYVITGVKINDSHIEIQPLNRSKVVVGISSNAFKNNKKIRSIEIPSSIISIENGAFYGCNNLESVVIPDSVLTIGQSAFAGTSTLKIYCEGKSKPVGWSKSWKSNPVVVQWGYTM